MSSRPAVIKDSCWLEFRWHVHLARSGLLRAAIGSSAGPVGLDVVAQTGTSGWILPLVRDRRPDLVVVDIQMPPPNTTDGLDAARQIRAEFPATAILVLSGHAEVEPAMDGWPPASGSAVC